MSNLWGRDDRIEDGTSLRDLEKKVHFLMQICINSGLINTRGGNQMDVPDEIDEDGNELVTSAPGSGL
jgi:hypothetical protein